MHLKKITPPFYSKISALWKKTEKHWLSDYYERKLGIFTEKILFYLGNILKDGRNFENHTHQKNN